MVYRTASVQKHRLFANVVKTFHIETPADRKQSVPKVSVMKCCTICQEVALIILGAKRRLHKQKKNTKFYQQ